MTRRDLATRLVSRVLLYGCLLWSAVMIGAGGVSTDVSHACLGEAGSGALPGR